VADPRPPIYILVPGPATSQCASDAARGESNEICNSRWIRSDKKLERTQTPADADVVASAANHGYLP